MNYFAGLGVQLNVDDTKLITVELSQQVGVGYFNFVIIVLRQPQYRYPLFTIHCLFGGFFLACAGGQQVVESIYNAIEAAYKGFEFRGARPG